MLSKNMTNGGIIKMAVSNVKVEFFCDIEKLWDLVTSLDEYNWRSDLSKIEVLDNGEKFIEYTTKGYATTFTVTAFKPCKLYEFNMENSNMKGRWRGVFTSMDGKTIADFTEEVNAKKALMKPFVGMYLKRQQMKYIEDLKRAAENKGIL